MQIHSCKDNMVQGTVFTFKHLGMVQMPHAYWLGHARVSFKI